MGTRANIVIMDGRKVVLTLYKQMDGYPTGLGEEIKEALHHGLCRVINGFSGEMIPEHFNSMGCLAAYLTGVLKGEQIGDIYVEGASMPKPENRHDYTYVLTASKPDDDGKSYLNLKVYNYSEPKPIYDGKLQAFCGKDIE